ncbi:MAG TPA: pseudaminic acid cytidylyltransferase [Burkholderiales bacterium]|nr:pseudaminic acid cytidylyltransferase [Burkholderiales bacterium]
MRIAVIPARGGSKRIPRKNVKLFCGKPMIAWSIDMAVKSGLFERIVVSTNDEEIARIASQWGAEVPFVRPAELSDDHTGTTEVVAHAAQWFLDRGQSLSAVCCIYATAPFLRSEDLATGLKALESGNWEYAFSVTDFPAPIFRSFQRLPEGGVEMFWPEQFHVRSQDLPVALHDAAQFYWGRPHAWIAGKKMFERHSTPVHIPRWRVQDIDTEADWERASILFNVLRDRNGT